MNAREIIVERIEMLTGQFALMFERAQLSERLHGEFDGATQILKYDAVMLNARLTEMETLLAVVDMNATDR